MKTNKNRRLNNLVNGLIAGALLFGCSCTLCNRRYYVTFIVPKVEAAASPNHEARQILEK